jgi:hypothetical protein
MNIERTVCFQKPRNTRRKSTASCGRVPRVGRLLALAIRLNQLICDGLVTDQAELARLGHVTRARLTQIMNLLQLAPDLQEHVLFTQDPDHGRSLLTERTLRSIVAVPCWAKQREMWQATIGPCAS